MSRRVRCLHARKEARRRRHAAARAGAAHRSTSDGEPSSRPLPAAVTTIAPYRPAYTSAASSTCEWYSHTTEEPSAGPGPARAGTCQV